MKFIYLSLSFLILFSMQKCNEDFLPETFDKKQIVLGTGGSYLDKSQEYILLENGQAFFRDNISDTLIVLKKVPKKETKKLFEEMANFKMNEIAYKDNNKHFYLSEKEAGKSNTISWKKSGHPPAKGTKDFYEKLLDKMKSDNSEVDFSSFQKNQHSLIQADIEKTKKKIAKQKMDTGNEQGKKSVSGPEQFDNYSGRIIVFGSGGGFTGKVEEYYVQDNGIVFHHSQLKKQVSEIANVGAEGVKKYFEKLDGMNFKKLIYQNPSNMYYYVMERKGDTFHKVTWGDMKPPPMAVKAIYDEMRSELVKRNSGGKPKYK